MKDRVLYTSQILYVGPSGAAGTLGQSAISGVTPTQLHHIKSIEHITETDTTYSYQYGSREPIGAAIAKPVEVSLEFEYNLADAQNEKWLGFNLSPLDTPFISGFLNQENDEQNFYILTTERGDAVTKASTPEFLAQQGMTVNSFGNCVIENYNISASLDTIPAATVKVRADNVEFAHGASGIKCPNDTECLIAEKVVLPAPREDNLQVDALRPYYLTLYFESDTLPQGGYVLPTGSGPQDGKSPCSLNSFEINLELPRRISERIGSKYPVSKHIQYPAQVEFSCVAASKDIVSGSLMDIFCAQGNNIIVSMDNPYTEEPNIKIKLKDLHLESEISEHTLLTQEFVTLKFSAPLGSPTGSAVGFYMSGVASAEQLTSYGVSSGQLLENEEALR